MKKENIHLDSLKEIKDMMERSSRFISLSGLSGVSAGIFALIGAAIAFIYLDYPIRYFDVNRYFISKSPEKFHASIILIIVLALTVLVLALLSGFLFTYIKAKKKNLPIWDKTTKRVIYNLLLPLASGGIFCIILLYHGIVFLVAPVMLIFYGLSLLNASKYTLKEIQYLGISEIVLGIMAAMMVGYGLIFWALGFGILHIIYGIIMYYKYEIN